MVTISSCQSKMCYETVWWMCKFSKELRLGKWREHVLLKWSVNTGVRWGYWKANLKCMFLSMGIVVITLLNYSVFLMAGFVPTELHDRHIMLVYEPPVPVLLLCTTGIVLVPHGLPCVGTTSTSYCCLLREQPSALSVPGAQVRRLVQCHHHSLHVWGE